MCEEETSRFKNGGILMGDFVTIRKNALKHPDIANRPSTFIDKLKEFMQTDQHLKVSVVKGTQAGSSADLTSGSDTPKEFWADVVRELAPGLFADVMTLPIEVLDVVFPEGNNWSPEQSNDKKYNNKVQIKPKEVEDTADDEINKQTQGNKRKLPTKDTKGGSTKKTKTESLEDAYNQVLTEG